MLFTAAQRSGTPRLTLAEVLLVGAGRFAVVDQRPLAVQVGRRAVGERLVVEVVEPAVVLRALRLAEEDERPAEEFRFDFARQAAGRLRRHLQLLVGVVVQARVLCDLLVGDADARHLEHSRVLARLGRLQAQILEVVRSLRVDELHKLAGRAAVRVAQHALHVVVVVLGRPAHEPLLVEAGRQAGLLRAGVDQRVVQAANDFVRHALEGPRTHADVVAPQLQLHHVVHAGRALRDGDRVVRAGHVLQLAERLLGGRQRVHDEAERGRLAVGLLAAPPLAFVQRQILHAVV